VSRMRARRPKGRKASNATQEMRKVSSSSGDTYLIINETNKEINGEINGINGGINGNKWSFLIR